MIANALSIAGSDPSGGAGIQADLKTFSACGVYGMAAITALTAQNTRGVTGVHLCPPDFVADQIATVRADVRVDAVKIGMIATAEIARAVARSLADLDVPVVLDPVMVAKGGHSLLDPSAVDALTNELLPLATHITPNLPEAAALLGQDIAQNQTAMETQARALLGLGPKAVILKGGHLDAPESPDLLLTEDSTLWLDAVRVPTVNTHGTGCTLSAALTAELARGATTASALRAAKSYVHGAIAAADQLSVGGGHGPTHHFHSLWQQS